ncbi:hypothetical protein HDV06_004694 [Boothiomyces sp. JEL0866]|nr:hypothetical protein HDV06_004694 [Boothiomyces sp. JEL0866]
MAKNLKNRKKRSIKDLKHQLAEKNKIPEDSHSTIPVAIQVVPTISEIEDQFDTSSSVAESENVSASDVDSEVLARSDKTEMHDDKKNEKVSQPAENPMSAVTVQYQYLLDFSEYKGLISHFANVAQSFKKIVLEKPTLYVPATLTAVFFLWIPILFSLPLLWTGFLVYHFIPAVRPTIKTQASTFEAKITEYIGTAPH